MPYSIEKITLEFKSKSDWAYSMSIIKSSGYFSSEVIYKDDLYDFSFQPENGLPEKTPYDLEIKNTIVHTMTQWFSLNDAVLFYICSNADSRALCRFKLFNRWFDEFSKSEFGRILLNFQGSDDEITHFACIFRSSYSRISDLLNEEKGIKAAIERKLFKPE